MDIERWKAIERELDALLELDAESRQRELARLVQVDAALAEEVANLLDHAVGESPLDAGIANLAPDLVDAIAPASQATLHAGDRIGNWEVQSELGSGGMGEVFLARRADGVYAREAALKLLRTGFGGNEGEVRFRREQRILAGLDHEGIARLYDAGVTEQGRAWIAMEFIPGEDLLSFARRSGMGVEARVALMERVCRAVAHAHRRGIVHRDLKPSNVLVDERDVESPRPVVVDFGIARRLDAGEPTLTRHALGTPGYMAPEQVGGEGLTDRRTDVFALGVLLYELLTGRRPFAAGSPSAELGRLLADEPDRPRRWLRHLPRDLEAILLACLERDPDRRYASAAALGEDLARFLAGDAPQRRPLGTAGRLWRGLRRRPALSAAMTLALVAMGASAGWSWWVSGQSELQSRLAQRLAAEAARIDSSMRLAHLAPLHDIRPQRDRLRGELVRLAGDVRTLPAASRAVGELALGRGELALGDPAAAQRHLQAALQLDPGQNEAALALAEALFELYRVERAEALRMRSDDLRAAELTRIEHERREPALAALAGSGSPETWPALLLARAAAWDGRIEVALAHAAAARERQPWLYEASLLEGDLAFEQSASLGNQAELREAALDRAEQAYGRASDIGRSDPRTWESRCRLAGRRLELAYYERDETLEPHAEAIEAHCGRALSIDRNRTAARVLRSRGRSRFAEHLLRQGADPTTQLHRAREDAEAALNNDPTAVDGLRSLADTLVALSDAAMERGSSEPESLQQAIELLQRAAALDPGNAGVWNSLGLAWWSQAEQARQHASDPLPALDDGIEALDRALALRPDYAHALSNHGALLRQRMETETSAGKDPRATFDRAHRSLSRALAVAPSNSYAHNNLGNLERQFGLWLLDQRRDPRPQLEAALQRFARASELNPRWTSPLVNAGSTHSLLARAALSLGLGDATAHYLAADAAFVAADRLKPDFLLGLLPHGESLIERAEQERLHGRTHARFAADAEILLARLRAIAPDDARVRSLQQRWETISAPTSPEPNAPAGVVIR